LSYKYVATIHQTLTTIYALAVVSCIAWRIFFSGMIKWFMILNKLGKPERLDIVGGQVMFLILMMLPRLY